MRRRRSLTLVLGLITYTVFFYRDQLFGDRVVVFRDAYTLFLTIDHAARTLAAFSWPPLWDPFAVLGKPFAADIETGVYYPINWLLRSLREPFGFNVSIALHHLIAASGMFALLRFRNLSLPAATLGGLVFGFGGTLVALDNLLNGLQSAIWIPWIILAFEVWCERRTAAALAGLSIAFAVAVLGAMPEFVVFANLLVLARAIDRSHSGPGPRWSTSMAALTAANVVALGLCAVQLVPLAEYLLHSSRLGGLNVEGVVDYSLHPLGVLAFALPRHYVDAGGQFHETAALWEGDFARAPWLLTLYAGAVLALLPAAFARLSRFQRAWWGGITIACLLLALGQYLPGYLWVIEHVAPLRMLRYPEKFLLVVHLALAVAVARGLEGVLQAPSRARGVAVVAASCAIGALIIGRVVAGTITLPAVLLASDLNVLGMLFGLVAATALVARTQPAVAGVAFVVLVAADLYRVNAALLPAMAWNDVRRPPRALAAMAHGADPLRIYSDGVGRPDVPAFPDSFVQEQNLLLMQNAGFHLIGNVNVPAAINLRDHERLEALLEQAPRERAAVLLGAFNVAYVTSPKPLDRPGLVLRQIPTDARDAFVYEVAPRVPRAFVPRAVRVVATADAAVTHLLNADDPSAEVAIGSDALPVGLPAAMGGSVRIESYLPERIELLAEMQTLGVVVVTDTYYPGWQATVDGAPTAIVRVNGFARGVLVDAGAHRIVMQYAPASHRIGIAISFATVFFVGFAVLRFRRAPIGSSV
ncbi:MAG: YfhO family protein [Deltaproteobacteria bacterium]|nr:YfhO family protein [Deltaproteobacteria bacterium]